MSRGKSFSCSTESISLLCFLQFVIVVVLLLHYHHQTCDAITITNNKTYCPPSSCGKIRNIKYPFRLKNDPTTCGDPRYELSCENNITTLTLFSGKYYVQEINYNSYTIRLVDPGIQEGDCSSVPRYFLTRNNFTYSLDPYELDLIDYGYIIYLKCSKPVKDDPGYVDTTPCINSDSKSYVYAFAADFNKRYDVPNYLSVGRLKDYCQVKLVAMSSSDFLSVSFEFGVTDRSLSYEEIHGMLLYGFELSWITGVCRESCGDNNIGCEFNQTTGECYQDDYPLPYCSTPLGALIYKSCDHLKMRIFMEDVILGTVKGLTHEEYDWLG